VSAILDSQLKFRRSFDCTPSNRRPVTLWLCSSVATLIQSEMSGQRILRDRAEADDLVQEVFLYIHRKSALFDSLKGSARSWIVQVAYTQALLRRRQLKSHGFYCSGITDRAAECRQPGDRGADYDRTVEGLFGRNGWKRSWRA